MLPRLRFLLETLEQGPAAGLEPQDNVLRMFACAGQPHDYYLAYFGVHQPARLSFNVPEGERYTGTVVYIWNMSATPLDQPVVSGSTLSLPGKPYHAVILRRMAWNGTRRGQARLRAKPRRYDRKRDVAAGLAPAAQKFGRLECKTTNSGPASGCFSSSSTATPPTPTGRRSARSRRSSAPAAVGDLKVSTSTIRSPATT